MTCGCCGGQGSPVQVVYVSRGVRCISPFCSRCDGVESWPNYTKTAPTKE